VSHRPTTELIRSLRATLQRIEESFASPEDQPVLAELGRIILLRIADLEFVEAAVGKANAEEAEHQDAVQLSDVEDNPDAA
jgi:hypothetical protein